MFTYDTVSEATRGLQKRGYNIDFNLKKDCLLSKDPELTLNSHEFEITEVYRFEGNTDPADEAVVYAIESKDGQKGVLVNGYGPEANTAAGEMARKLQIQHKP